MSCVGGRHRLSVRGSSWTWPKPSKSLTLPGVSATGRGPPAVEGEVDLGGQPGSGPAEGLARLRAARIFQFVPVCGPFLRAPAAC